MFKENARAAPRKICARTKNRQNCDMKVRAFATGTENRSRHRIQLLGKALGAELPTSPSLALLA
jgi:hypothetical protein